MGFTHLHVHTEYSLLDGACRIEPMLDHISNMGQTSVAITDHGVMYGAIDFYKAAKSRGIKPIIGCEVYVAPESMYDKQGVTAKVRNHLVLLCENNEGYKNLTHIVSKSFTDGFFVKPRADKELLRKHSKGIIALSACLAGEIPTNLLNGNYEGALAAANEYRDIFGKDNFFIEVQNHGLPEQIKIIPDLIKLSKETGIPLVATNDAHYIQKEDSKIQKILVCIQTNHTIDEDTGMNFNTDEFYLKSEDEMRELFTFLPEAVDNTQAIAERCNVTFEFGKIVLPYFEAPDNMENKDYLRALALTGFKKRYGDSLTPETYEKYMARLDYELSTVNQMGYTDYYLIVFDFVRFAKSQGIPVGPGRGSGAGSIVAYCIGITDVDPMKYNLLFERFLNPERVSMPDFDIDFCYERRSEVIDYVNRKYGEDRVAQIVTFGTLAARAAIKDVGRVLSVSYAKTNEVAKKIPWKLGHNLKSAIEISPELKKMYETDLEVRELIDTALKIEGMPRHASTHAAGVVITRDPVSEYVPLACKDGAVVTQYTMTTLEELGLLKMDFLGLRTLTVINDCERMIKEREPDFSIKNIDYSDKETYAMFGRGDTEGVFQFESPGMKIVMQQFKPGSVEDLTALTSLYRPGPMDSIPTYIKNRHNPEKIKYKTPQLESILGVTYGCMVYQEQVMQICRELAGYSLGHADIVRRAMSKKKHAVMEEERVNFVKGCEGNGISSNIANSIFDDMVSFASYAFNKSHAAAYATLAFQTAYLKCHYPAEFMAAQITSVLYLTDKVSQYIAECQNLGIKIIPPSVNQSCAEFTINDGSICFGLLAVKGLGRGLIDDIERERELNGPYTSFYSFIKRIYGKNFNRKAAESLIKCGALDFSGLNRRQMMTLLPEILTTLDNDRHKNVEGQIGLFDIGGDLATAEAEPVPPNIPEFSTNDLLAYEKETTGLYISGHPMQEYTEAAKKIGSAKVCELLSAGEDGKSKYGDNSYVHLLAMVSGIHIKITKNNAAMANAIAEDITGGIELVVFPKTYTECGSFLRENEVVLIDGRLSVNPDEKPQLLCTLIQPFSKNYLNSENGESAVKNKPKKKSGLFIRLESKEAEALQALISVLKGAGSGETPAYFYFEDTKKYQPANESIGKDALQVDENLLNELKCIAGDKNVVLQ